MAKFLDDNKVMCSPVNQMVNKTPEPSVFGRYLRKRRIAAGMSLREVADAMSVSHVLIAEVERGVRTSLKRERWKQLAEIIPGFSEDEIEREMAPLRGVQLELTDAPRAYLDLGLALARRIDRRDLRPAELDALLSILNSEDDDE